MTEKKQRIVSQIRGYSERGIVNSITYFLNDNPEHIYAFIETLGIHLEKCNYNFTFLIEQSFYAFGDSDLVIIANNGKKKTVIFIECKVKTYQGTFKIESEFKKIKNAIDINEKTDGISSNLFVQLYNKHLLIDTKGGSSNDSAVKGISKKHKEKIPKKLGGNEIVHKAFKEVKDASDYYYVAITPEKMDNEKFRDKINKLELMPSENAYLCDWENIENYLEKVKATKVLEMFEYNKGQIY